MERELDAVRRTLLEKEVRQGILTDERDRLRNEVMYKLGHLQQAFLPPNLSSSQQWSRRLLCSSKTRSTSLTN